MRIRIDRVSPLLLASLLFVSAAHAADERAQLIDQVMQHAPLPCAEAALNAFRPVMRTVVASAVIGGLRESWQLNEHWTPANPAHQEASLLMSKAMEESERRSGPLVAPLSVAAVVRHALEEMPIDALRESTQFFSHPAGRMYAMYMMDYLMCNAIINIRSDTPNIPALDAALQARIDGYKKNAEADIEALPPADRSEFDGAATSLGPVMSDASTDLFKTVGTKVARARLLEILEANRVRIEALTSPYRLVPATGD